MVSDTFNFVISFVFNALLMVSDTFKFHVLNGYNGLLMVSDTFNLEPLGLVVRGALRALRRRVPTCLSAPPRRRVPTSLSALYASASSACSRVFRGSNYR